MLCAEFILRHGHAWTGTHIMTHSRMDREIGRYRNRGRYRDTERNRDMGRYRDMGKYRDNGEIQK